MVTYWDAYTWHEKAKSDLRFILDIAANEAEDDTLDDSILDDLVEAIARRRYTAGLMDIALRSVR